MAAIDRHLTLITLLRDGAVHRARDIARRLGVTQRTIYRDMDRLAAAGIPVQGTRGTGYRISNAICLPPLRLTPPELEALNLGLAIVAQAADDALQSAADTLAQKIDAALPLDHIATANEWKDALTPFADPTRNLTHMPLLRSAISARQKVRVTYTGAEGAVATHVLRPLHLEYRGRIWMLTAWCEEISDFNTFRLDQMDQTEALPDLFIDEPGKRLQDLRG
jgi:predicted DNA-binding transcriptional regulator YafY